MKKSQTSLEFLIILGIGFFLIAILGAVFINLSSSQEESLNVNQIQAVGEEIISTSERMYFRGLGNKVTLSASFPPEIENLTIHRIENATYLNFTVYKDQRLISYVFLPLRNQVKINCTLCSHDNVNNVSWYSPLDFNEGQKRISVQSMGSWVSIDFVK